MIGRRVFVQGAGWLALQALAPGGARAADPNPAPTPAAEREPSPDALGSNHNYYLYGGGRPIRGIVVTIDVTEEIFAPEGLGMQLNGYGPQGAGCIWQQYVVGVNHEPTGPLTLGWSIENWPSKELREKLVRTAHLKDEGDLFNVHAGDVGALPTFAAPARRVPAGYRIRWELLTDANDPDGLIIGAIYSITDNHGHTWSSGPRKILDFKYSHTNVRVTREALAALTAFDLNMVGTNGGRYMFIESGAGTITYEALTPMTPEFQQPKTVSAQNIFTAEMSNFRYGELDHAPSRKFVQTFRAARTPKFRPGGPLALAPRLGADALGLFAISVEGKLGGYALAANGRGRELSLGPRNMALPGSAVTTIRQVGPKDRPGVVTVDQEGQIVEFSFDRDGGISGPAPAGPKAITHGGMPLAASRQFGTDQTDLFLVDEKGQLKVLWRRDGGQWSGPTNIGPEQFTGKFAHLAAGRLGKGDQTGVFVVDKQGALTVFRAEKNGAWMGPQTIGEEGFAPTGAPITVFEGEERTFLFLVDRHGQAHMAVAESDGTFAAPKPVGPKDIAAAGAPLAVVRRARAPQFVLFLVDKKGILTLIAVDRDGQADKSKPLGPVAPNGRAKFIAAARPSGDRDAIDVYAIADGGPHDGEAIRFRSDDGEVWGGPELVTN
jgi:hypothetical protein